MSPNLKQMTREFGSAFAVLAIYVLVLLAPLHHAAGLQRDFDQLGFQTYSSWSVCAPLAQDEDGNPTASTAIKCPASGISKNDLVAVLPTGIVLVEPVVSAPSALPHTPRLGLAALPEHFGQSRAPPVAA